MPKVQKLGASMLRGNENNFYIRCNDDLDDQDCHTNRGNLEYPHIHVKTDGPYAHNDILYIGITFGPYGGRNIDIYDNGQYMLERRRLMELMQRHLKGLSPDRHEPLSQYLFGTHVHDSNQ
ncbi:hypothetical protein [Dyella mobilis]|uniref:Uncharacterized protein n=1 Tax=Dyella mobilis TaxID=1849582 RepID=A0ABS2KDV0_9GAMM|nr:hypothetical protein [Dyella mobilis]MBM7129025.1 hypothetical protein [Dyella mobilis]GLQ99281.1 hypothetical protein GCM10007863_37010 [Dyella mobilis]